MLKRYMLVDLFSGSYNEENIGHELLNDQKNPITGKYLGSYSLSNTINVIHGEGRPILIDINTSALNPEKTSRHVVFAYGLGYDAQLSPARFIIVNDGWGNNNVWVNSSMLNGTETLKMQK